MMRLNFMNKDINDPLIAPIPKDLKEYPRGLYNPYPAFSIDTGEIGVGFPALAKNIKAQINLGLRVLAVDGYHGADWAQFRQNLAGALEKRNVFPDWIDVSECMAGEEQILERIEPFLGGDDRIFGFRFPFGPEVFFNSRKVAELRTEAAVLRGNKAGSLTIFYGLGAGLIEVWDQLWYIDIPKDWIQVNAKAGKIKNIGSKKYDGFEPFYKRAYFVEWPALNRHKQRIIDKIDLLIDLQKPAEPTFISGKDFRKNLNEVSRSAFRVRPWYYSGPWGGRYMQGHFGVHPDKINLSTSFEIITPENGIVLEKDGKRLEFSFDFLMYQANELILGKQAARQFRYEWPIRLDYLDTIDGGNLSTQVHPRPNFVRKEFGETFTQDESYYIINAKPGAKVYIGLTDDCDPDEFYQAVTESAEKGIEVDIDRYVNSEPSKPHDLFLIPNGTVHGSGKDNLVLEISATTYIFTFKIYDWMRRDLNGKFRPLNIERAWKNIRFERKSKWVKENLIAKPKLIEKTVDWKKYLLAEQKENWWAVHRVEFDHEFEMNTGDIAYALNLVEGESVNVKTANGREYPLAWAESMIVPAAAEYFKVVNRGAKPCKLLLVFVRPGIGTREPLNNPND